jgi:hypothetical protein
VNTKLGARSWSNCVRSQSHYGRKQGEWMGTSGSRSKELGKSRMKNSAGPKMHSWKEARRILVKGQGYSSMKNSAGPKMHSLELFYSIYVWVQDCEMPRLWYISMAKYEARIWRGCDDVDVNVALRIVNMCVCLAIPLNYPALFMCESRTVKCPFVISPQDVW